MKRIMLFIAFSFIAIGCSEEMLSPGWVDFEVSGSDVRVSGSGVSWKTFSSKIVGSGWECVDTKEILDDGSLSKSSYWPRDGGGPAAYYFDESLLTKFYSVMADLQNPDRCSIIPYRYEDSAVVPEKGEKMVIVKVSGDRFSCVEFLGYAFLGFDKEPKLKYGYSTYKRMSDKKLSEYRTEYSEKGGN
jgi:hypothetical protein